MKKWKKFIAMGLAVSMIVPSCIPQTLWASEFSAGSVESAADVFEDGAGYETGNESGNKISDENNSGDEFGTGELKDQEPEQSETEDSVNAGQSAEGYNILLYSDGKLEKTHSPISRMIFPRTSVLKCSSTWQPEVPPQRIR